MSAMTFSDDMARIQRAVAQCRDIVLRYSQVLEALQLRRGERVLEVGCGGGFLAAEVAQCVGPTGEVHAIDISADQIAAAKNRCAELGNSGDDGAVDVMTAGVVAIRHHRRVLAPRRVVHG